MTSFAIKIIACITMFLDHIKYAIPSAQNFFTIYGGRLSFPLFAFLITEGYVHTKNLKKYVTRLMLFGIISQIPFMFFRTLVGEWKMLNIMFTMLLGILAIFVYDKINKKYVSLLVVVLIVFLGYVLKVDYGAYGVLTVFIIYVFKNNKKIFSVAYGTLIFIYYYYWFRNQVIEMPNILYLICTLFSIIIISFYNGKQGRKIKYFFYWFYPIHMIIVYLISLKYLI